MLRPYPGTNLNQKEDNFNDRLSTARKTIENAFGRNYRKFGIYATDIEAEPGHADFYVLAACILHNFTQIEDRGFPYYGFEDEEKELRTGHGPDWSNDPDNRVEALKCREIVSEYLFIAKNR
jgi:hypothetical protein